MVMADPGQIEQVIMNLAVNARDAMPQGGVITIETDNVYSGRGLCPEATWRSIPGPYVMLAVSDTGRGMDEATQARIFEPFFTTKEMGKGHGAGPVHGLWHCQTERRPYLSLQRTGAWHDLQGLPAAPQPVGRERSRRALPSAPCIVVRKPSCWWRTKIWCGRWPGASWSMNGYTVLEAASGHDALSVSQQTQGRIHLMLTDVVMPGISGGETAELLKAQRPEMKVLFMSGHTENSIVHHGVLNPGVAFLQKPFKHDLLVSKVREVLDGPPTLH